MITVLMATWQGADYVREQIESILSQTRSVDRILISDDGSTDGTLAILSEYQTGYPDLIEVLHHGGQIDQGTLCGAAANFFFLMERERGRLPVEPLDGETAVDYWFLSDQDDVWIVDKVEKMCREMEEEVKRVGNGAPILLYSDVKVVDGEKRTLSDSLFRYQHMDPARTGFSEVLVENPVTGGAAMFNESLLRLIDPIPAFCVMHDWWLALVASCFGHIICLPESLSLYRQHGSNVMGASRTGSFQDLKTRCGRDKEVAENYRHMFRQAECFLLQYGQRITVNERAVLQGYLSLGYLSPIRRLKAIRTYSLYKTSLVQTLAQCLTIKR